LPLEGGEEVDLIVRVLAVLLVAWLLVRYPPLRKFVWVAMCAIFGLVLTLAGAIVLAAPMILSGIIVLLVLLGRHNPRSTAVALDAMDRQ
jgi:hypothetical protein